MKGVEVTGGESGRDNSKLLPWYFYGIYWCKKYACEKSFLNFQYFLGQLVNFSRLPQTRDNCLGISMIPILRYQQLNLQTSTGVKG